MSECLLSHHCVMHLRAAVALATGQIDMLRERLDEFRSVERVIWRTHCTCRMWERMQEAIHARAA